MEMHWAACKSSQKIERSPTSSLRGGNFNATWNILKPWHGECIKIWPVTIATPIWALDIPWSHHTFLSLGTSAFGKVPRDQVSWDSQELPWPRWDKDETDGCWLQVAFKIPKLLHPSLSQWHTRESRSKWKRQNLPGTIVRTATSATHNQAKFHLPHGTTPFHDYTLSDRSGMSTAPHAIKSINIRVAELPSGCEFILCAIGYEVHGLVEVLPGKSGMSTCQLQLRRHSRSVP